MTERKNDEGSERGIRKGGVNARGDKTSKKGMELRWIQRGGGTWGGKGNSKKSPGAEKGDKTKWNFGLSRRHRVAL